MDGMNIYQPIFFFLALGLFSFLVLLKIYQTWLSVVVWRRVMKLVLAQSASNKELNNLINALKAKQKREFGS